MTARERLIELLKKVDQTVSEEIADGKVTTGMEMYGSTADHLLSHGVTVQEWIPASEPPKEYRNECGELVLFLVCSEGTEYPFRAMYDGKTWGDGVFAIPVKWWMPLPQQPKEET